MFVCSNKTKIIKIQSQDPGINRDCVISGVLELAKPILKYQNPDYNKTYNRGLYVLLVFYCNILGLEGGGTLTDALHENELGSNGGKA
ncbi:hypothetical protein C2G38_2165967 [Gigaspora rosea]|uniref:Uncharacterized protein n=1 Tax=Gigaspora rosea TaxID=44941 RepID=A0A397W271_9GLOM|nr:hypothetical protein C2G38_2165967 [Gigaspora rosea]